MPRKRYSIVATLGPATDSDELLAGLLEAGADGFRLNGSHLGPDALERWLTRLARLDPAGEIPVILDLQGSKWRLGEFPEFDLMEGAAVELVSAATAATAAITAAAASPRELPVPHPDFFAAAPRSSRELRLDDARCLLQVEACEPTRLRARVVRGGRIRPRKGITFSRSAFRRESLGDWDRELHERTSGLDAANLRYALSYVRDAAEMQTYRRLLGPSAYLIAKIERDSAVQEAPATADSANELWLCRGDLGAELGARRMAEAVYEFSGAVKDLPVPVLLAGQVFEHMTRSPSPTRSEVCFLYEALRQGYCGVVLSDETAVGDYPVESCRAAALFR